MISKFFESDSSIKTAWFQISFVRGCIVILGWSGLVTGGAGVYLTVVWGARLKELTWDILHDKYEIIQCFFFFVLRYCVIKFSPFDWYWPYITFDCQNEQRCTHYISMRSIRLLLLEYHDCNFFHTHTFTWHHYCRDSAICKDLKCWWDDVCWRWRSDSLELWRCWSEI